MWWVFQIGAWEHYAIARALHGAGLLGGLVTDVWVPSGSHWSGWCPQRMRDRFHEELGEVRVLSFNWRMGALEAGLRMRRKRGMAVTGRGVMLRALEAGLGQVAKCVRERRRLCARENEFIPEWKQPS